jgi:hypothetical protein
MAAEAPAEAADTPARPQVSAKRARQSAAATAKEPPADVPVEAVVLEAAGTPTCPKCGGRMWDNRLSKRNPKAPDFKCRDRSCDGVIWPTRPGASASPQAAKPADAAGSADTLDASPLGMSLDDIPF